MALQIRRGTEAQRAVLTGVAGELLYTTDTKKLYVGDGVTAGGTVVAIDLTGAEIKSLYEAEANAFTDTKNTKLDGIETGATATAFASQAEAEAGVENTKAMTALRTTQAIAGGAVVSGRNVIINGDMSVDQRNSGSSITPTNGQYGVDRWAGAVNVSNKYSMQQVSDAPTGFIYSSKVTSLSAYSIGAGETAGFRQYVEGYNIAKLDWGTSDAQTVTLSFWVKSSLTGDFGVTVGNDTGRTYGKLYNISSANTWEKKSVTIEGDTSGTWLTTNGKGISLVFALSTGAPFLVTAGSWNVGIDYGVTGQTQILATNSATWQVTGVQLEAGTVATPFEHRPYPAVLALCQRYYEQIINENRMLISSGYINNGAGHFQSQYYAVPKRAGPTITIVGSWSTNMFGQPTVYSALANGYALFAVGTATGNSPFCSPNGAGNGLKINAEL